MFVKMFAKSLIILALLSTVYFFYARAEASKEKNISIHYSNLVKNKLAYASLAKLDPKKPGFDSEKSNLVGIIQETNRIGLEKSLNDREKEIFTRQNAILGKVFATKSYQEGVAILKSAEGVKLLTDQTKLIEELSLALR